MGQTNMDAIEVDSLGPVKNCRIEIDPEGGLHELLGENGAGKSRTLEAVAAYVRGDGSITPNYDLTEGSVSGLGTARLRVGRKTTRSGELDVETPEGDDLAILVDPHVKDPERADAERLKALCRLSRVTPDLKPFEEIAGGTDALRAIASAKSLALETLPEMAAGIKRDLEAVARKIEGESEVEAGRSQGLRQGTQGVDTKLPSDAAALGGALEAAIRKQEDLRTRAAAASLAARTAEEASRKLQAARDGYTGKTVDQAREAAAAAGKAVEEALEEVRRIEALLTEARAAVLTAQGAKKTAVAELSRAEEHVASTRGWEDAIQGAASSRPAPSDDEVSVADEAVAAARLAVEQGAVVRGALAKLADAQAAAKKAGELSAKAGRYRTMASACEEVVSKSIQAVAPRGMKVLNGRLKVTTPKGEENFADLSKGQRTIIGAHIQIDAINAAAPEVLPIIIIAQELREGLDPAATKDLHEALRSRRTVGLTARATGGALRAERYADAF